MERQNFFEWLKSFNESLSLYVKDYDASEDIENLDDLSNYLLKSVILPIIQRFTPEEAAKYTTEGRPYYEIMAPDGSYYSNGDLTLNFYTMGWPETAIQKALSGIKYFLDEKGVTYKPFRVDRSSMFNGQVVRIPIASLTTTQNAPPQLNLSNRNAQVIFGDVLNFSNDVLDGSPIDPRDLIMKIDYVTNFAIGNAEIPQSTDQSPNNATVYDGGLSQDQINRSLQTIRAIAQWAIDNHYSSLVLA